MIHNCQLNAEFGGGQGKYRYDFSVPASVFSYSFSQTPVPAKWMPPEALTKGVFSLKSDV